MGADMKCECKPRMNHRITIQSVTATQDAYGAPTNTWATFAEAWADIQPIGGFERVIAMQTEAQVTHRIRTQWISGVTPKMRVIYNSRTFNIISVINENERNKELNLTCQETL